MLKQTGLALRPEELTAIAVADFGLGELEESGAQILTLLDTPEIAVKLIVLFPGQTLPQHRHPPLGDHPGKAETLRCAWGELWLYAEGPAVSSPRARPPAARRHTYTVWAEFAMQPGDQVTLPPNTWHWFQAGPSGAVAWSYSTRATDAQDVFADPDVRRETVVMEERE